MNETLGFYIVDCNATAPPFSVVLGGKSFAIDPKDQIFDAGVDQDGNPMCISGTTGGGAATFFVL